ncbi:MULTISPECIES: extracellular solute-binding protein [unclassified Paraburkholderia]|uniref:extracellular solute-binding protein n=1 Tax=unclassified Paraburkholderia TaxID=2615204 RepID=UPI002AB058AE|nr:MULTISPECIES: extracellular solute-binding protein [unclassified Paraburkholderia]
MRAASVKLPERKRMRPSMAAWASIAALTLSMGTAHAEEAVRVTYAGSMGVVMDQGLGPAFAQQNHVQYQGQGEGAYGMARLLASKNLVADVFFSITPGPMDILKRAGLIDEAIPVASTSMVIAYNPKSAYAKQLAASQTAGAQPWWQVLAQPGLRFGRTDAKIDPQGQNIIFTMMLAERYYQQPGLKNRLLGDTENPREVFGEGGLLTRLEAGQVDASSGYESAVKSAGLPYIPLPDQINLSNPAYAQDWYNTVSFNIRNPAGELKALKPQPLVFYVAILKNAPHPLEAKKFAAFALSPQGQAIFKARGYGQPKGDVLH